MQLVAYSKFEIKQLFYNMQILAYCGYNRILGFYIRFLLKGKICVVKTRDHGAARDRSWQWL